MPIFSDKELDDVYAAIGELLTDDEIKTLVKRATGKDIYNEWAAENDPRKIKLKKTISALKLEGNERWLLTRILIYAAEQERLRQKRQKLSEKIVNAFPKTLKGLPHADSHVAKALGYLQLVLTTPFPPQLRLQLRPKRESFADIAQQILTLFAYKHIHQYWLLLLFTLSYNEALLAGGGKSVVPDLGCIAQQIDDIVTQSPAALALLGPVTQEEREKILKLTALQASLRATDAAQPAAAARIIEELQRLVRGNLSHLNQVIFRGVLELSFEPLMDDLPTDVEARAEFKDLVQAMRDLTATILARTLKQKMWQDAENQMSLVGSLFDCPGDAAGMADDWLRLRSFVDWLSELEPDEAWAKEAEKHTVEIDHELFKEGNLDKAVRAHFLAYRKWFKDPFKKMDEALKEDCGSLRKMDAPLMTILKELTPK